MRKNQLERHAFDFPGTWTTNEGTMNDKWLAQQVEYLLAVVIQ